MSGSGDASALLSGLDEVQVKLLNEECILVDNDDVKIGCASKKDCHLWLNIEKGMLHRAFSVFLFNTRGQLLLQQRSAAKITYPNHFTNTCCSHPLNIDTELDESDAIGVKRAAQRKLGHELGVVPEQLPLDAFTYLTRIHYKADNVPHDGKFGEHEIDYILFVQRDVDLAPNDNEVRSHRYVDQAQLKSLLEHADEQGLLITPWFKLIADRFLYKWWDQLHDLASVLDQSTVHRML